MDEKILTVPTNSGMDAASLMAISVYNIHKKRLTNDYNKWDFVVTMNMIKSDMYPLLKSWFPEEKDFKDKIIELSINWLNDEDYPDHKIWNYFR